MEPGHEDREYFPFCLGTVNPHWPQWSPVMKTGNTGPSALIACCTFVPQWSPVMKTGNTHARQYDAHNLGKPQWSPVMKTGNTRARRATSSSLGRLNGARS